MECRSIWKMAIEAMPLAIIVAFALLCVVGLCAGLPLYFGAVYWTAVIASPFAGAGLVWAILRHVNRRDDPRRAKAPPDPP